jgi:hypothetical protein
LLLGLAALLSMVIAIGASVATVQRGPPPAADRQPGERKPGMKTYRFEVERLEYPLPGRALERVNAAFERVVPGGSFTSPPTTHQRCFSSSRMMT